MKLLDCIKRNRVLKGITLSIYWFFTDYCYNHIVCHIPFWNVRRFFYRLQGAKFGKGTQMDMNCTVMGLGSLRMGDHCHINNACLIDARGSIVIHNNVSISHRVVIMTGSHDYKSSDFHFVGTNVEIEDYVWIGVNATIIGNVHIGKGAVVCAGAVVCRDVEPYSVVAGTPAKEIRKRENNQNYTILENIYGFPTFS